MPLGVFLCTEVSGRGGGGTEGKCDMLTQLIGLFGAAVVAWYARDVLGWAICYGR